MIGLNRMRRNMMHVRIDIRKTPLHSAPLIALLKRKELHIVYAKPYRLCILELLYFSLGVMFNQQSKRIGLNMD